MTWRFLNGWVGSVLYNGLQHSHRGLHGFNVKRSLVREVDLWVKDSTVLLETSGDGRSTMQAKGSTHRAYSLNACQISKNGEGDGSGGFAGWLKSRHVLHWPPRRTAVTKGGNCGRNGGRYLSIVHQGEAVLLRGASFRNRVSA